MYTTGYNHICVMLKLSEDASSVHWHGVIPFWMFIMVGVVRIGDYIYGSNWITNTMGKWVCLEWIQVK